MLEKRLVQPELVLLYYTARLGLRDNGRVLLAHADNISTRDGYYRTSSQQHCGDDMSKFRDMGPGANIRGQMMFDSDVGCIIGGAPRDRTVAIYSQCRRECLRQT
jgi:hypothetical protein